MLRRVVGLVVACCLVVSASCADLLLVDSHDAAYIKHGEPVTLDQAGLSSLFCALSGLVPPVKVDSRGSQAVRHTHTLFSAAIKRRGEEGGHGPCRRPCRGGTLRDPAARQITCRGGQSAPPGDGV